MTVVKPIKKTVIATLGLLALSLMFSSASLGQIKSGTITGTVTDSTGAVVTGDKRIRSEPGDQCGNHHSHG